MASLLCELDVVRVGLKYPDSPATDPLHRSAFISRLRQTGDLGGGSSHATGHNPGLYAWNELRITRGCALLVCVAPFVSYDFSACNLHIQPQSTACLLCGGGGRKCKDAWEWLLWMNFCKSTSVWLTSRFGPSMVGDSGAHFTCRHHQAQQMTGCKNTFQKHTEVWDNKRVTGDGKHASPYCSYFAVTYCENE